MEKVTKKTTVVGFAAEFKRVLDIISTKLNEQQVQINTLHIQIDNLERRIDELQNPTLFDK